MIHFTVPTFIFKKIVIMWLEFPAQRKVKPQRKNRISCGFLQIDLSLSLPIHFLHLH